jgi:hypothetical protein
MYTLTLNKEDFKEEAYWIALCDSLDVPNTSEEIVLEVNVVNYH